MSTYANLVFKISIGKFDVLKNNDLKNPIVFELLAVHSFIEFSKNKAFALFLEAQGAFSSSEGAGRRPGPVASCWEREKAQGAMPLGHLVGLPS